MNKIVDLRSQPSAPPPPVPMDSDAAGASSTGGSHAHSVDDRAARVKRVMEQFLDTVENQRRPHPEWIEIAHAAADRFVEMAYAAGALDSALEGSRIGLALQDLEQDARPLREVRVLIRGLRMDLDRVWARQGGPADSGEQAADAPPEPAPPPAPRTDIGSPDSIPTDGTFSYLGTAGFPFDPELTQIFLTEVGEQIPSAERVLLVLESHPEDARPVNDLFRVLHTIKGNSGFLGLREFIRLVHTMEQYLEPFRSRGAQLADLETELLLQGVDLLRRFLVNLQLRTEILAGNPVATAEPVDWEPTLAKLLAACRG